MNRQEAQWDEVLRTDPNVALHLYDKIKLRLANSTWYSPDFWVITTDGVIEIHEIKGHWEDDARVKIKVAADQFWWIVFKAIRKRSKKEAVKAGSLWAIEEIGYGARKRPTEGHQRQERLDLHQHGPDQH